MLIAVETSDIVASTKLSKALRSEAVASIKDCYSKALVNQYDQFDFFRGDAYQVLYSQAQNSLKQSLLTKLFLMSMLPQEISVTQSIALGHTSNIETNLGENMDDVFVISGRTLDTLKSGYLNINYSELSADFSLLMEFANRLLSGITAKQAQILYWWILLGFPEHKVIADQLSVSRQNINTHLLRSNADLFKKLLLNFSEQIERLTIHD
ncbi:hypothetical protein ACOI22_02835 [Glaciecola sp. 2405UD65-10]|uniref:hypothetical protein n=1 Tax=Glaciecola sp. 2405UD65-10 TaxID=3397244 RepID=UPI003B5CBC2C